MINSPALNENETHLLRFCRTCGELPPTLLHFSLLSRHFLIIGRTISAPTLTVDIFFLLLPTSTHNSAGRERRRKLGECLISFFPSLRFPTNQNVIGLPLLISASLYVFAPCGLFSFSLPIRGRSETERSLSRIQSPDHSICSSAEGKLIDLALLSQIIGRSASSRDGKEGCACVRARV